MKKMILIIILMMPITCSWSQNYHHLVDTNKMWSTFHIYGMTPSTDFTKFHGEETLDGKIYKKVWTTTDTLLVNWTFKAYIREDNDRKVYFRYWTGGPDDFRYDFGANEGDTIFLFYDPMGFYFVVDSVDGLILLTGETRKRINLSCFAPDDVVIGNDIWIERMGSLYGVMQSGSCALVGDMPQLICFTENDTLKYFNDNFDNCFLVTGTENHPFSGRVRLFPNPSNGMIVLKTDEKQVLLLKITFYDPTGREVFRKEVTGTESTIDISSHGIPGLIFYKFTGSNGFTGSGKILILAK